VLLYRFSSWRKSGSKVAATVTEVNGWPPAPRNSLCRMNFYENNPLFSILAAKLKHISSGGRCPRQELCEYASKSLKSILFALIDTVSHIMRAQKLLKI
jgi:hypothetical protein